MASTKPNQQTIPANITSLVKELLELGQQAKPSERRGPQGPTTVVIRGK